MSATASSSSGIPAVTMTPSNGAPARAGLLHEALAAELQLPQVRVEEQRVELYLRGPARAASVSFATLSAKICLGHLSATGELGPVAGVGGGGDDRRVDRGRGHAGEQDRRATGQAGERGLDNRCGRRAATPAVGAELGPRGSGHRGCAPGRAGCADRRGWRRRRCPMPCAADDGNVMRVSEVAGSEVEDPRGAGVDGARRRRRPSRPDRRGRRGERGPFLVDIAAHGPIGRRGRSLRECGMVEADSTARGSKTGAKTAPPRFLASRSRVCSASICSHRC